MFEGVDADQEAVKAALHVAAELRIYTVPERLVPLSRR